MVNTLLPGNHKDQGQPGFSSYWNAEHRYDHAGLHSAFMITAGLAYGESSGPACLCAVCWACGVMLSTELRCLVMWGFRHCCLLDIISASSHLCSNFHLPLTVETSRWHPWWYTQPVLMALETPNQPLSVAESHKTHTTHRGELRYS